MQSNIIFYKNIIFSLVLVGGGKQTLIIDHSVNSNIHLVPVFDAKEKVKKGEIKAEDIPYMQRGNGASWDNSDVKGAKKKQWNDKDKIYNANDTQGGIDWTGRSMRKGPTMPVTKCSKYAP